MRQNEAGIPRLEADAHPLLELPATSAEAHRPYMEEDAHRTEEEADPKVGGDLAILTYLNTSTKIRYSKVPKRRM